MSLQICKFSLGVDPGRAVIEMPADAEILSVGLQGKSLMLWAIVDPDRATSRRTIEIFFTGQPFEIADRKFIGSVQHEGAIATVLWHVFEWIGELIPVQECEMGGGR